MQITGPILPNLPPPAENNAFGLRLNQRISAEVIQVSDSKVILAWEGYPIVARLETSEQAIELMAHRWAQFVVTELSDREVVLRPVAGRLPKPAPRAGLPDLAQRVLEQSGLPVNAQTLPLTRAVLSQGLAVTPELLHEILTVMRELKGWSEDDARLAAAMKALGMPLTAESLMVMRKEQAPLAETVEALGRLLRSLAGREGLPAALVEGAQSGLAVLEEMAVRWNLPAGTLAERFQAAARLLGRPLEAELARQLALPPEQARLAGLPQLARLAAALQATGEAELGRALEPLVDHARATQLLNVQPEAVPGRGEWNELAFVLKGGPNEPAAELYNARLLVARRSGPGGSKIDPSYTRLIVEVEVRPGETVQVDLSLVGRQIQAHVNVTDPGLITPARAELPELEAGISALGYHLAGTQVGVGRTETRPSPQKLAATTLSIHSVDLQV